MLFFEAIPLSFVMLLSFEVVVESELIVLLVLESEVLGFMAPEFELVSEPALPGCAIPLPGWAVPLPGCAIPLPGCANPLDPAEPA